MKKWYQPCGLVLLAALALNFSGCTSTKAYMSKWTGRKTDDQKLVDVDGKSKKDNTSSKDASTKTAKKTDPAKAKSADSQLAQKTTKPKAQSTDGSSTELASAKDTTVKKAPAKKPTESVDPFQSEEFEALAAKKSTPAKGDAADGTLAQTSRQGTPKQGTKAAADGDAGSIQEVSHEVADPDMPDWAADRGGSSNGKVATKSGASETKTVAATEVATGAAAGVMIAELDSDAPAQTKPKNSVAKPKAPVTDSTASVVLVDLCPDATGELRDELVAMKVNDVDGLKKRIHSVGRMGPEAKAAAPALVYLLKHDDGFVRTHAALALARMQASPPEAVQTVVDGLKSSDPGIRSFAAAVLAEMGPQATDALATLAESLKDRDGYVRLHAAEVLIRYEDWSHQSLDILLAALKDKDENVRWLATYSLAELTPESPETVEALIKATRDRVLKVQVGAIYALCEIGPYAKAACTDLRKLADTTPHPEVQSAILYALQQIEQ